MTIEQLRQAAHKKAEMVAELCEKHNIPADVALQIINQEAVQAVSSTSEYGL